MPELDELKSKYKVLIFPEPNEEWLDFVFANRNGSYNGEHYDIVFGPVANDTIYRTFIAYEEKSLNTSDNLMQGGIRMGESSIKAMLEFIIPRLIRMLMERQSLTEKEALTQLYSSELYRQLEREETKLWHLSVLTLYDLWVEEKETGHITYPEEA